MKTIGTAAAAALLMMAGLLSTATPAVADSSACTHAWSGPQICIRLTGHNGANAVTGFWANPPRSVSSRSVVLTMDGVRHGGRATAKRVGKTISYSWRRFNTGSHTKLCVRFARIDRVACQTTKYSGSR
ncbi:hypothetical protein [Streptomyces sp. SGAir0957]